MINNANRNKIFLLTIVILLVVNIALLAFFLQRKTPGKQPERPDRKAVISNFLRKEIGFDQQQLSLYDTLSNRHWQKVASLYEVMRTNKNLQLKQLAILNFNDSAINEIASRSITAQKPVETEMLNYIKSIRLLCTQAQLPKFDSLFIKIFTRRGDGKKRNEK